jgi:nucleoside 2-deoxyribosyltransferase
MKKVYLAARFLRREEMEGYVPLFNELGYDVIARWVFGGEEELTREQIARLDLDDVAEAETLVIFTHPRGEPQPGGGRFVEMGYALALGKEVIVIGPHENVFTSTTGVKVYDNLEDFSKGILTSVIPDHDLQIDRKIA